jgi:hypothetical protein
MLTDNQKEVFKQFLNKYNRYNCPEKLYKAWKILILGTSEYKENEEEILENTYNTGL